MKLGFTLKKAKRTGLLATGPAQGDANGSAVSRAFDSSAVKATDAVEKVYVTDFDPTAPPSTAAEKKATLVIPLLKANAWKAPAAVLDAETSADVTAAVDGKKEENEKGQKTELTEDEAAAAELLADVQAQQSGDSAGQKANVTLVIPMAKGAAASDTAVHDPLAEKRAQLYKLNGEKKDTTAVPILQQNAVPGMDELADVTEKFRHDVDLRPDELDVHSAAYDNVPIEDFGAAMLRGMGWKGSMDEENPDADDPKPRQRLLGLGATAKPKVAGDTGKDDRRRGDMQPRANGLNRREDKDEKRHKASSSSGKDDRRKRSSERGKSRSRSRDRDRRKDREPSRRAEKDSDDDRQRYRDRDEKHRREKLKESYREQSSSNGREQQSSRAREGDRQRGRDHERGRDRDRSRGREGDRERGRDRDRDLDRREERGTRKRSRSRDRSSDRQKSSRR